MDDPTLFQRRIVKRIDIKAIFENAAGHPVEQRTRTIVDNVPVRTTVDDTHTLSGIKKPGSFTIFPGRRKEQYFV